VEKIKVPLNSVKNVEYLVKGIFAFITVAAKLFLKSIFQENFVKNQEAY
jgi:hypothetical protein